MQHKPFKIKTMIVDPLLTLFPILYSQAQLGLKYCKNSEKNFEIKYTKGYNNPTDDQLSIVEMYLNC